jgi:hypothetical protein
LISEALKAKVRFNTGKRVSNVKGAVIESSTLVTMSSWKIYVSDGGSSSILTSTLVTVGSLQMFEGSLEPVNQPFCQMLLVKVA